MGSQVPTHRACPDYAFSFGKQATDFAANKTGLILDPWQSDFLQDAMAVSVGKWAARDVGLIVPRQNGKGAVLEALVLYHLFVIKETKLILWTAHEFKTAKEAFRRIVDLVENSPSLMKHVKAIRTGVGEEGIELIRDEANNEPGARLRFVARSRSSARGFSADLVILDEAYDLTNDQVSAILPTVLARPNSQVWYTSSAPLLTSTVLRRLCKRGRKGYPGWGERLVYGEWCADASDPLDSPVTWAKANPGYGIRLYEEGIKGLLESLDEEDFQREAIGVWLEDAMETVIPLADWKWQILEFDGEEASDIYDVHALAIDTTPSRDYSVIVACGRMPDGLYLIEVIQIGAGTKWVVPRLQEIIPKHQPRVLVIDGGSPAASLLDALKEAEYYEIKDPEEGPDFEEGEIIYVTNGTEMARACGAFYDGITDSKNTFHLDDADLNSAIEGAAQRPLGDSWAWSRKKSSSNISPLVAGTLARFGLMMFGGDEEEDLSPIAIW